MGEISPVTSPSYQQIRCPFCHKLAAEAAPGSSLRVKCVRCGRMFERQVAPERRP